MYGRCDSFNHWKIVSTIQECITDGSKCNSAESSILYLALFLIVGGICGPLDQKSLEKVPEPRWVCFKLWVIKSRSCFRHSTRSHIREFWIRPTCQSSQCFWSAFLVFRKMRLRSESAETFIQNTLGKGPLFGQMVARIDFWFFSISPAFALEFLGNVRGNESQPHFCSLKFHMSGGISGPTNHIPVQSSGSTNSHTSYRPPPLFHQWQRVDRIPFY